MNYPFKKIITRNFPLNVASTKAPFPWPFLSTSLHAVRIEICQVTRSELAYSWYNNMAGVTQSQPSVGREGPNRVRWPVSKKPVSTKPIFLTYVSLPFDVYRQEKRLSGHGF